MFYVNYEVYFVHYYLKTQFKSFLPPFITSCCASVSHIFTCCTKISCKWWDDQCVLVLRGKEPASPDICLFVPQGSSSDSEGEVSSKSFLKKKPEAPSEATKFLKSAKGSGVRGHLIRLQQEKQKIWWERHNTCTVTWAKI